MSTPVLPAPSRLSALEGRVVPRRELSRSTVDAMYELLGAHFDGVNRATFEGDLAGKDAAILLEDEAGGLRGFSTIRVFESRREPISVVYSGDTIVERAWWGSPALARTWIRAVRSLAPDPARELWWLLLTSGFRTYRFLPVFFRDFHPRPEGPMPADVRARRDALAYELFDERFDPAAGVVRFTPPQVLAGELLGVSEGRAEDPYVRFFLAQNPGYVRGDELVCLARIHAENLTPAARRMVRGAGGAR